MNPASSSATLEPYIQSVDVFNRQLSILETLTNNVNLSTSWIGVLFSVVFALIFGLLGFSVYMVIDSKRSQEDAKREIKKINEISSWAEKQKGSINQVIKNTNKLFKDFQKSVENGEIKLTKEQETKLLKRIEKIESSSKEVSWPTIGYGVSTSASMSTSKPSFINEYTTFSGTPSLSYNGTNIQSEGENTNLSKLLENIDKLKGTVSEYTIDSSQTTKNSQ